MIIQNKCFLYFKYFLKVLLLHREILKFWSNDIFSWECICATNSNDDSKVVLSSSERNLFIFCGLRIKVFSRWNSPRFLNDWDILHIRCGSYLCQHPGRMFPLLLSKMRRNHICQYQRILRYSNPIHPRSWIASNCDCN